MSWVAGVACAAPEEYSCKTDVRWVTFNWSQNLKDEGSSEACLKLQLRSRPPLMLYPSHEFGMLRTVTSPEHEKELRNQTYQWVVVDLFSVTKWT